MKKLFGSIACTGIVRGKVFKVNENNIDFDKMIDGQILVIKFSSPHYYELFMRASGVLAEFGGVTSHAAALARDLNLPCLVSIDNLFDNLNDGDDVLIDAIEGVVYIYDGK